MQHADTHERSVVIVHRAVPEYRAPFFRLLATYLAERHVRLILAVPDSANYPALADLVSPVPVKQYSLGKRQLIWQRALPVLRGCQLVIMEQGSRLLLTYPLLFGRVLGRVPVALWGHGVNFQRSGRSGIGEAAKKWFSRRADWWFAYTEASVTALSALEYPLDRITVVQNSIDTSALRRELEKTRDNSRASLGLPDKGPIGAFIGTIYPEKRVDLAIAATALIRSKIPDFNLVVMGSGPALASLQEQARGASGVFFMPADAGRQKAALLTVADLLVIPGAVGLIAVDSLVAGVPIVTLADADHGPEIAYLKHGRTARIVDQPTVERYAESVIELLTDRKALDEMQRECRCHSSNFSISKMAENFGEGVLQALDAGRR